MNNNRILINKLKSLENINSNLLNIVLALFGTLLLAISSKVQVPFWPVPMTMQTFVVLFIGISFGWKLGLSTVVLYLAEGIMGLPVFAGTPEKGSGMIYFTGPTMGYLIGFLSAVYLSGIFKFKNWLINNSVKDFLSNFLKLILAVSTIYLLGVIWLSNFTGWEKVLAAGVKPFVLAELFKILLLSFMIPIILKFKR